MNKAHTGVLLIITLALIGISVYSDITLSNLKKQTAVIREELEEAYSKMTTNDTITAYINAQRTFQAVIDQMNNILSFHITGKIPGGCSGNCSSCNSCG